MVVKDTVPTVNPGRPLTPRERELYRYARARGVCAIDAFGQALYLRNDR